MPPPPATPSHRAGRPRPTTGDPTLFAALAQVRAERQTVFPLRTAENLKGGAERALMLAPP